MTTCEEDLPKYTHTYTEFNQKRNIWDKTKIEKYQNLAGGALCSALEFWNFPEAIPRAYIQVRIAN